MPPLIFVAGLLVTVALIGFMIWWLFIETEGVYIGKRVVIWLYDVYANRYDAIKGNEPTDEHIFLAVPLMVAVRPHEDPFVLDVATGTGRIPRALCAHERFTGHVVGVELSRRMIGVAARELDLQEVSEEMVTLLWGDGTHIPYTDNAFDVVTCMEALEFMPEPRKVIVELARVLRPGGTLLTTLRWNAPGMPHVWDEPTMQAVLNVSGLTSVRIDRWQMDYKLVWARKEGNSDHLGIQLPEDNLQCPRCQYVEFEVTLTHWRCPQCGMQAPVGSDGVIEWVKLSPRMSIS